MIKKLLQLVVVITMLCTISACNESSSGSNSPEPNSPNSPTDTAWRMTTKAGISVAVEKSTIVQYNQHWAVNAVNETSWRWEDIDWITLDEAFDVFKQFYCVQLDWDCKDAAPSELSIYIKPWDSRCVDAETPSQPYEIYEYINGAWNCIDGWFLYNTRTVYFHLGDDPGTDHDTTWEGVTTHYFAFQETALADELKHFFQWKSGKPMVNDDTPTPSIPSDIIGYRIILPGGASAEPNDKDEDDQTNAN